VDRTSLRRVSRAAWSAVPEGVSGVDVALLEGGGARHRFSQGDVNRLAAESLSESWRLFVRTHSRAEHTWTTLCATAEGRDGRLLIRTVDHPQLTVVHVSLNPSHARRWLEQQLG
jgi:hypothetical protein